MKYIRCLLFSLIICSPLLSQAQSSAGGSQNVVAGSNYTLQPLDIIEVSVFQEPDLQTQVRISQDGSISLPLIGKVQIAGMTLMDATSLVTQLYDRDYLVNPQVSMLLLQYTEQRAYVHGQVNRPGPVIIPPEEHMTITQAISAAGGLTRLASYSIQLTRTDKDGKKKVMELDFKDILKDPNAKDVEIQNGDSIFVPESII